MEKLANIQKDKLLHFFYGAIISFVGVSVLGLHGLWLTAIAGAWKELYYDWWLGKGKPDVMDFLWTIFPVVMILAYYLTLYLPPLK